MAQLADDFFDNLVDLVAGGGVGEVFAAEEMKDTVSEFTDKESVGGAERLGSGEQSFADGVRLERHEPAVLVLHPTRQHGFRPRSKVRRRVG